MFSSQILWWNLHKICGLTLLFQLDLRNGAFNVSSFEGRLGLLLLNHPNDMDDNIRISTVTKIIF